MAVHVKIYRHVRDGNHAWHMLLWLQNVHTLRSNWTEEDKRDATGLPNRFSSSEELSAHKPASHGEQQLAQ
jgi:hypothetical protein